VFEKLKLHLIRKNNLAAEAIGNTGSRQRREKEEEEN